MTEDDRVQAVVNMGLTRRQAAFLVSVMLHSGVCVPRQYCAFAGIAWGRKPHHFFAALLARGYATAHQTGSQSARVYHVHHKPLYRAIGQENNRHRKPMALARAVEGLMILDAVIANR